MKSNNMPPGNEVHAGVRSVALGSSVGDQSGMGARNAGEVLLDGTIFPQICACNHKPQCPFLRVVCFGCERNRMLGLAQWAFPHKVAHARTNSARDGFLLWAVCG